MKRLLHAALIISAPLGLLACSGDRDRVPGPSDEGESSFQASEQTNYIKASNTDPEDFFGESVSLDGDTLVVGAYLEDSSATGIDGNQNNNDAAYSGAVYVFVRDGDTWTQQAYIKASNAEAGDLFGNSVSLDGDTLVVGALGEDSNATGIDGDQNNNDASTSGAAYVFVRDGDTWTQQAYIKASTTDAFDYFGYSVSLDGDTLVVGAYLEDSSATGIDGNQNNNDAAYSGAVYVFVRDGDTWTQQAYIKASNTDPEDYFGESVSLDGDTLVVGAGAEGSNATGIDGNQNNNDAQSSGAVYVFVRDGDTWTQQAYIKASNAEAGDLFGNSVSLDGDTLVVGALGEDSNATGIDGDQNNNDASTSGAAYVFVRDGDTWTQQAYIKASTTDAFDYFGESVSLDGDTLVVGAGDEDSSATGIDGDQNNNDASTSGAAYVFVRDGDTWTQQAYIKASTTDAFDYFGYSVSLDGDTLVVGAYLEDSSATGIDGNQNNNDAAYSGAVYVFK